MGLRLWWLQKGIDKSRSYMPWQKGICKAQIKVRMGSKIRQKAGWARRFRKKGLPNVGHRIKWHNWLDINFLFQILHKRIFFWWLLVWQVGRFVWNHLRFYIVYFPYSPKHCSSSGPWLLKSSLHQQWTLRSGSNDCKQQFITETVIQLQLKERQSFCYS